MTEQHDQAGSTTGKHTEQAETESIERGAQVRADHEGPVAASEGQASEQPADPRVAEVVGRLDSLSELPLEEQVEVYESVHRVLQESLAEAAQPGEEHHPRSAPS